MGWQEKLAEMVNGYDAQIAGLQTQIRALQNKARDIQEQAEALDTTKFINNFCRESY